MTKETIKATAWGLLFTFTLAGLIVAGSRNLSHLDAALVGYTFAVLFAAFAVPIPCQGMLTIADNNNTTVK